MAQRLSDQSNVLNNLSQHYSSFAAKFSGFQRHNSMSINLASIATKIFYIGINVE